MSISRREFLEATALGPVASSALGAAEGSLPTRTLGRTGRKVTILAFGCGSRFLMYKEEDKALEALNRALELGIRYLDTAYSYGNGLSETRVGTIMKTRRNEVFLADKVEERNGDKALRIIEGSLKRLQTDHVDLLHIHALEDEKDLAAIEAPDGVLKTLYKLRDEKVARAIGITCHANPRALKLALEHNDFDCTQMALNAGQATMGPGFKPKVEPEASFQELALPVARRKNMGVIAMKVFAQENLLAAAPVEKLVRYSMSLPVASVVAGMPKLEHIAANAAIARNFKPMPPDEMKELARELSAKYRARLDRLFAHHVDA